MNIDLIESEKKKDAIFSKLELLEKELKNNVLGAEGRIDNHGNLEYTSIRKEFERYNLDLVKLLSDEELVKQELINANALLSSLEEKMEVAKICFNNMPNIDTRKLYNISYHDVLDARYRIILIRFAGLLLNDYTNYDGIRNKRIDLINLIKERSKILLDLGIKFLVDPFDRIKLNDQLEIVELLGGNLQNALMIKEKIRYTFDTVDRLNEKNDELYLIISQDDELFNNQEVNSVSEDNTYKGNILDYRKVLSIKDVSDRFNSKLVKEKTKGVITRVYELFNKVPVTYEEQGVVPNLVIEKSNNPLESNNDVFTTESDNQEVFESDHNTLENRKDIFVDESQEQGIFESSNGRLVNDNDDNLFTEVEPFEKTVLLTNKYDDGFLQIDEKKNDNEEMPELFFEFEDKVSNKDINVNDDNENKNLSFDEQIQELLDEDTSKVKKLVA